MPFYMWADGMWAGMIKPDCGHILCTQPSGTQNVVGH